MTHEDVLDAIHGPDGPPQISDTDPRILWLVTAFKAMNRELPADPILSSGIALHWVQAGTVMPIDAWLKEMEMA
jgi:hypothetical protein